MAPAPETALEVVNLSHSFGPTEILRGINLQVQQGQVVAVVGPSGGGKTTLLHLCAGLLEVIEGQVRNTFQRSAVVFQDARLLPWQTAADNIAFGLKARGVAKVERWQRAHDIAAQLGLSADDLSKFPKDLSGGMRQRVAFARALVTQPQLLFLDEPFSALDIGLKRELQTLLVEQVAQQDLSILFITHDLMEAVRLSDHIILLGSDPGHVVTRFELEQAQLQRDDNFVYQQTSALLQHPQIMQTFELVAGGVTHGN